MYLYTSTNRYCNAYPIHTHTHTHARTHTRTHCMSIHEGGYNPELWPVRNCYISTDMCQAHTFSLCIKGFVILWPHFSFTKVKIYTENKKGGPSQVLYFMIRLTLCHSLFLSLFPRVLWSSSTVTNMFYTYVCI
jgi:hypothetical protein